MAFLSPYIFCFQAPLAKKAVDTIEKVMVGSICPHSIGSLDVNKFMVSHWSPPCGRNQTSLKILLYDIEIDLRCDVGGQDYNPLGV